MKSLCPESGTLKTIWIPNKDRTLNRQISSSYAFSLSSRGLDGKPNYYEVPMRQASSVETASIQTLLED